MGLYSPASQSALYSTPTTHHFNLPCHHPQALLQAGLHCLQLGLLFLAWKVGELSAPIQRGQGRGANGRRGEGIESQGSKGMKALEEGLIVKVWEGSPVSKDGERIDRGKGGKNASRKYFLHTGPYQQPLLVSRRDRQGGSVTWVLNASPGSAAIIEKKI